MARGNQRELARAKNAKKQQTTTAPASNKAGNLGFSTEKRMERDADAMRQKQQKALEKKGAEEQMKNERNNKVVKIDPLKQL